MSCEILRAEQSFFFACNQHQKIERRIFSGFFLKLAAISRTSALPEPSSIAPL